DRWMMSRLMSAVESTTIALDKLRVREAINTILYHLDNDIAWYNRRLGVRKGKLDSRDRILRRVLETRARMLAPLAPHTAEEIWTRLANKGFVVQTDWPQKDETQRDDMAERSEAMIRQVLEDTGEVLKATGITPRRIAYYTAAVWKWKIYLKALKAADEKKNQGDLIKEVLEDPQIRSLGKTAADFAAKAIRHASQMPEEMRKLRLRNGTVEEKPVLVDAAGLYQREYKCPVEIWNEEDVGMDDPKGRARMSEPYRPAIYLE
ncbi:MAG TPA: class I tRNA ligase family protein, partial [Candidatus Bathyarchaeia archaeon]|nr:class I tRNA ligase family protein [Candidatus Bathyarchaeia archaeon]